MFKKNISRIFFMVQVGAHKRIVGATWNSQHRLLLAANTILFCFTRSKINFSSNKMAAHWNVKKTSSTRPPTKSFSLTSHWSLPLSPCTSKTASRWLLKDTRRSRRLSYQPCLEATILMTNIFVNLNPKSSRLQHLQYVRNLCGINLYIQKLLFYRTYIS